MKKILSCMLLTAFFTACGTMPEERAVSGAGLGAVTGLTLIEGAAIKRYQTDNGLPVDGLARPELIAHLQQGY